MSTALTRRHWLALGAGAVLCGLAAAGPRLFPVNSNRSIVEARIAERAALSEYDDATKHRLTERLATVQAEGWSASRVQSLKARFGPEWRCDEGVISGGYRVVKLEVEGLQLQAWPTLVKLVDELERESGLTIVAAEIGTAGTGAARSFTMVRLSLRLRATSSRKR